MNFFESVLQSQNYVFACVNSELPMIIADLAANLMLGAQKQCKKRCNGDFWKCVFNMQKPEKLFFERFIRDTDLKQRANERQCIGIHV